MLRLRTFGGLSLEGGEGVGPAGSGLQRRPLALLALLAAACDRGCAREEVLLYLWPERTPERGRNVLKQTLYALRRDLKTPTLFLSDKDTLRLNPAVISTDVGEFEAAVAREDLPLAVELYKGPFLEGFHIRESPEFERWLELERARLAGEFARATTSLAHRAAAAGEEGLAIELWRRLAAVDPMDPEATLGLMAALARSGDRAAAIQQYRIYQTLLETSGTVQPDPRVTALVSQLIDPPPSPTGERDPPAPAAGPPDRRSQGRRVVLGVVLAGLVLLALWVITSRRTRDGQESAPMVVIAPFRVTGDSSLLYLREGMIDLLAAKFTGDAGPRAVDPRTTTVAWARKAGGASGDLTEPAARDVAQGLGARHLLLGGVVGTTRWMTITATLLDASTGNAVVNASVEGPPDSLPALVERLAGQVLVGLAGDFPMGPRSVVTASLPALRQYLNGMAEYRRGRYDQAIAHFERALDYDSTFAVAAFQLAMTGYWLRGSAWLNRLELAWRYRDRLSTRDRVVLEAIAGPHYPATAFWAEDLSAAELAVDAVPEAPEPWFLLGDVFFHLGPGLGRPHSWEQADRAFRRAFELDSAFMAPLEHMVELTAATGDLDEAKRLARMYFGSGQMSQNADFLRWRLAVAARDSAGLARIREELPGMTTASLLRIVGTGQLEGVASLELDHAAAVLGSRPAPVSERWLIGRSLHYFALNRGRVRHAATEAALDPEGQPLPDWAERLVVLDGLFGDGDTLAAIRSLQHLDHQPQPGSDDGSSGRAARDANLCVSENWRTLRREGARTRETIARLRQPWVGEDSLGVARSNLVCATLLEAVVAQRTLGAEVSYPLRRLDSLMLLGPAATNEVETFGNLVVAQLYERAGEPEAALAALRRRPYQWAYGPMFLTTFLREEGRLAASTGDREGAIRAYHHYLALRTAPDSSLFRVVTDVRRELSRLASER